MFKKIVLYFVLSFVGSSLSWGQDFDKLLKGKVHCQGISYNSAEYYVRYMQQNQTDSIVPLLNYWEQKCGEREPIYRAKMLLALKQGKFSEDFLGSGALQNLFNYRNRQDIINSADFYAYDTFQSAYGFIPPGQNFDRYTKALAQELKSRYDETSIEYLFAEFYGGETDAIFSKIQQNDYGYKESPLVKEYYKTVALYRKMLEWHMAFFSGIWMPTGELSILGNHPEIGIQFGVKSGKMNYDLTMSFKFIQAKNDYYAIRKGGDGKPELTDKFFGGYFGLDVGRDIYAKNRHEIQAIGGIAYDGFDTFEKDKDKDEKRSTSTSSYNFNLGLGYRYYVTDSFYLGLRAKYNVVDYTSNNVIDYKGNHITVSVVVGNLNNAFRNKNLKALKQEIRK